MNYMMNYILNSCSAGKYGRGHCLLVKEEKSSARKIMWNIRKLKRETLARNCLSAY